VTKLFLTGIDNDDALSNPVVQIKRGSRQLQHILGVRNVLYLYPRLLDRPIAPRVRSLLIGDKNQVSFEGPTSCSSCYFCPSFSCSCSSSTLKRRHQGVDSLRLVLEWLYQLRKQNRRYEILLEEGWVDQETYFDMGLPLQLVAGTSEKINETLKHIITILKGKSSFLLHFLILLRSQRGRRGEEERRREEEGDFILLFHSSSVCLMFSFLFSPRLQIPMSHF
jgi:hypothetical protein